MAIKYFARCVSKNKVYSHYCTPLALTLTFAFSLANLQAQAPEPPLPVETFWGHQSLYYQVVAKKKFSKESNFGYFGLATFTADYKNNLSENRLITIAQFDYSLGKGFGIMAGTDINSVSGFSPIAGPTYTFASKKWLAVTTLSYFLNGDSDLKIFGLYEFLPSVGNNWNLYSRLQFIMNQNLSEGSHNKSYLYLRGGLQRGTFIFGFAANLDWSGPNKNYGENYGPFIRWEF